MKESEKLAIKILKRAFQNDPIDRDLFFKEAVQLAHQVNKERIRERMRKLVEIWLAENIKIKRQ